MAAYAALVSLLNNVRAIMNHPTLSASLDDEQIQPLLEKTNFLLSFIEGSSYGGDSKEARDLERKIASAAHAAEDLIESHIVDQIHAVRDQTESNIVDQIHEGRSRRPYFMKLLLKCVGCRIKDEEQLPTHLAGPLTESGETAFMGIHRSEKSFDLQHIIEDMDAIIKEANQFKEERRLGEKQIPTHLAEARRMQNGETTMVGLDAELNQLLDKLTGYQSSRRIISIVGMGGTGKTTLAKNVYENLLIKEHFQFRAWAAISQQNNAQEVLSKLISSVGELSSEKVDYLGLQLHKTLSGRKYLIVLDDIWRVRDWDEVKRFFPDNQNGSRILLTTRLSNVAKDCGSSLFMMNLLNDSNSWKLFCERAFQGQDCPPELWHVGKQIVKLCKGLALSIVVIGGLLLQLPRYVGYWMSLARDLTSISNSKGKQETLDVLSLSYNHLPPHLKPCFLYMGVFKEDYEISVTKMIKLWVAEGFIKPVESHVLEEIAMGYVNDLIDRNLIFVRRSRKNGKVRCCGIHDLLRDLCIKLAEQEALFHMSKGGIRGTERRLVDDWNVQGTKVELPLTRSIMTQKCIKPSVEYRLLRVLDETESIPNTNYYVNVNLRYVAYITPYSFNGLRHVPSSIPLLWNLQTIIIKRDREILIVMPVEIWKVRQLRHVECWMMYIPNPHRQDELLMLENLQTLTTIVNFDLCEEVCRIIPNIKKLHLFYDIENQGYDHKLIESLCNLDRLQKLETLQISMSAGTILYANEKFEGILSASFPRSLVKLSLGWNKLKWDDMKMIGSLPQLEVLEMKHILVIGGGKWSPFEEQFLRLKFLKIESCGLDCWDADSSHFPVLKELILTDLNRLEEIPLSIGDISTLKRIHVDRCSNSAAISALRIQEDQVDNDNQLQVQVRVYAKDMKSFNQILETEGLTTDHVQLKIWGTI